jgi:glycerophosphoryl diester phosphodiesterase
MAAPRHNRQPGDAPAPQGGIRDHGPVQRQPGSPGRPRRPIGFAHRGARSERRENTIEAFTRALELGATGLESDAWITADAEVVLDHDGVTGTWWHRRAFSGQSRAELPAHVPTLADLYRACGDDFELSLDVKDPAAFGRILSVAAAAGVPGRLWLCHADAQLLAGWRAGAGEARLVQSTRLDRIPEGLAARARELRAAGIDALNLHRRDWTAERVSVVRHVGLAAFAWDAQSRADIDRLLRFGVDGVYSDHVEVLMTAILDLAGDAGRPE